MSRRLTPVNVVVLALVGLVLVAVLLRSVNVAREAARRARCFNNDMQLCLALLNFEARHKHFPGYKQDLAGHEVGWAVMLLPYLDRKDLWKRWEEGKQEKKFLRLMFCPSDPPATARADEGPCSYVVNTQVCKDGTGLSWDYINAHDGAATTLLLSENLMADKPHEWWDTDPARVGFTVGRMADNLGSNHGGGVVVGWCDGHVSFLRSDIGDDLYNALVTPDGGEKVDEDDL
jgi:prepilin-type processing-associated H-X9-DG protein